MQVKEVMTIDPACCVLETSLQEVAQMMIDHDCGEIPVVENKQNYLPIGVITDRDIVCRTIAKGSNPLGSSRRIRFGGFRWLMRAEVAVASCHSPTLRCAPGKV